MHAQLYNRTVRVKGLNIFYREVGDRENPSILLLHGFPTSSLMFKNLMTALSDRFHLVAPDYPGFGFSDFPSIQGFDYSFDNFAAHIDGFTSRSEEHTSELQSRENLVCRLLLEKKKIT